MKTFRASLLEFWNGLTTPSLLSLVITFLVSIVTFSSVCIFVTPDLLAGPGHRYLMRDSFDSIVPKTAKILSFRHSESPDVVIMGDSLTVRCLSNEERLAGIIAERLGGVKPVVFDLSFDGMNVWQMLEFANLLPPEFDGVVIFGVGPGLLGVSPSDVAEELKNPQIGFLSKVVDHEAQSAGLTVPYRTGIHFIDNWRYFLARRHYILRNLFFTGEQPIGDPLNVPWMQEVNQPEYWEKEIREFSRNTQQYESNKQFNLALIARIMTMLKTHGNPSFVLLQAPFNPRWWDVPKGKEFFERYTNDLHQFAFQQGMSFFSATSEVALAPNDFVDYEGHIGTPEARARCTKAVASHTAHILAKKSQPLVDSDERENTATVVLGKTLKASSQFAQSTF